MNGAMRRDLRRSIFRSMGRFLAIMAIVALGSGFLVGLRTTKSAMLATAQTYIDRQSLFDFRVLNTYGYTQKDVEALSAIPGIAYAEGTVSMDMLMHFNGEDDYALRVMSLPSTVSVPELQAGRMPQAPDECLADGFFFQETALGAKLTVSAENTDDVLDRLSVQEFTIVGLCSSPLYMNFERGSTTVGKGALSAYIYVPGAAFSMDGVYTEIDLKLAENYPMYDESYNTLLESMTDQIEPLAQALSQARYETVLNEAKAPLEEGQAEYEKGLAQYEESQVKAEKELADGKAELDRQWAELTGKEEELEAGEASLSAAQAKIDSGRQQLSQGVASLQAKKEEAERQFADTQAQLMQKQTETKQALEQLDGALEQLNAGLAQIIPALSQLETGLAQLESSLELSQTALAAQQEALKQVEAALMQEPENQTLLEAKAELEGKISDLVRQIHALEIEKQNLQLQQAELNTQKTNFEVQIETLSAQRQSAADGLSQIENGFAQLAASREQADSSFSDAAGQLEANRLALENGQAQINANRQTLAQGREQLEAGRQQLTDAQESYEQASKEADAQLSDAKKELEQAKQDLEEGWQEINKLEPASTYILDRNTNAAYVCFESDAGIVESIGKVFPLFFFAVAALVCLTTMSKLIDEERTQIGVKKALGYSSFAISTKYLIYSGCASLAGCLIGISIGSVVFPAAIWQGYNIMYNFADHIQFISNVPLCTFVAASFTLVMLLVTWLCCRKELKEVPAELIRPKIPKAGKRLFLERLSIWKHLGFLRKVSIRNIFRYKKRLFMMLLGVGGCTALVLTGLGVRDSIAHIAEYQYEEVTVYDISVSFGKDQDAAAQEAFQDALADTISGVQFLHDSTADASAGKFTKSVHLLSSDLGLTDFVNLHFEDQPVSFPEAGQAVINNGLAETMNLQIGDAIYLRTPNMEQLHLTVSGIFDNNVFNYVLVSQETVQAQLGHPAEINTAYLHISEDSDVYEVSAQVSAQQDVLTVSVSKDMETRINSMLKSMDYIVALIVLCAAALAFVVMYNLTNINISERIREIATVKVLGFYSWESAAYVFREGLALTAMGAILGLFAGKYLHAFVINQIRIDTMFFTPRIQGISYLGAVSLTFLFAVIVDFFLYFKLEHINMAEALKSVE